MLGFSKVNLLVLGSLLAPAFAASIRGTGAGIEISDTRITGTGGIFRDGETVSGTNIATGGLIVADADWGFINEIREAWQTAQGSSSGIYYELQQVEFIVYPDQSKPWPDSVKWAIYLAPMNS
ncbi:hypothetical protein FZEAL_3492 [Fusarium zealandicum]|uniref:Uncharacterized protein n=1 Tax=Fusarium zealandicum TaxID=1053134 RepID=A0A8H4UP32_9HYPO|nr:hypothetical protein FZEAL_3492 [Fusarium zealandicum]